jgi:Trypsin-co-occurring domain 2
MDLKDFVADVISQLEDGLIEAINRHDAKNVPGRVNPVFKGADGQYDWKSAVQNIEFDISVTVSDKKSGEAGAGVKVYVADISGKGSKSHEDTTTNRIKFTIPVSLPAHRVS